LGLRLRFLDALNVDYLKSQIETGNASRTKKALQDICKHYRSGYRIRPHQLAGMEQSIVGLIYTQRNDEKVRRWALNALARLGREPNSMEAVKQVLQDFAHEPETVAAAIAATYRMSRDAPRVLKTLNFEPQMITLAALQHVDAEKLDLSALPLNVEKALPDLLKLALIVVGLDRAPVNLLNPRHSNGEMVKALGGHHDKIVSQYTVWAITENPTLGVSDLGMDIQDIEQQPSNVRGWIFRLLAMTRDDAEKYTEYIVLGTKDPEAEARIGLAGGLRDTYFDGLEIIVMDWFVSESEPDVSQLLMDHMVRQARHCSNYEHMALDVYEKEPTNSSARQRMLANAAGTPIYVKMREVEADANDLFRGAQHVTNNTFNVSGGIQGGAVSLGGDAKNAGATSIHYNPQTVEHIQSELSKAERELYNAKIDADLRREALQHVQTAKADPAPDKLSKAIDILSKVETITTKAVGAGTAIGSIATALAKLSGLM
jgi:hypothetical protein